MKSKVTALRCFAFNPQKVSGSNFTLSNRPGYLFTRFIANQKQKFVRGLRKIVIAGLFIKLACHLMICLCLPLWQLPNYQLCWTFCSFLTILLFLTSYLSIAPVWTIITERWYVLYCMVICSCFIFYSIYFLKVGDHDYIFGLVLGTE